MLPRHCLLLARAWVSRELGGPRVYLPSPTTPLVGGAQGHMAVLEVGQSQHCWALELEGKLILVLGGEEVLSTQRGLNVVVLALWSQSEEPGRTA